MLVRVDEALVNSWTAARIGVSALLGFMNAGSLKLGLKAIEEESHGANKVSWSQALGELLHVSVWGLATVYSPFLVSSLCGSDF